MNRLIFLKVKITKSAGQEWEKNLKSLQYLSPDLIPGGIATLPSYVRRNFQYIENIFIPRSPSLFCISFHSPRQYQNIVRDVFKSYCYSWFALRDFVDIAHKGRRLNISCKYIQLLGKLSFLQCTIFSGKF